MAQGRGKGGEAGAGGRGTSESNRAEPAKREAAADTGVDGEIDAEALLSDVEVLSALGRLDLEAALAYEAAAELIDDTEIANQLRVFGRDHRRHVEGITRVLERDGAGEMAPEGDVAVGMLASLARVAAPLGTSSLALTMLANEQLTNLSYEDALAYEWDEEEERLLEEFRADEERHMRWLSDKHDEMEAQAAEGEVPSSPS